MKNRNSSSAQRLSIKYSDTDIKELSQKPKKKLSNSSFFQKSAQIIQNYSQLLKKTPDHFGDAEAYFKQTLRSYNEFDLKSLKFDTPNPVRSNRSCDILRPEKRKHHLGSGDSKDKPRTQLKLQKKRSRPSTAVKKKEKFEEEEVDIFYSPSSHLTGDNLSTGMMAEEAEGGYDYGEGMPSDFAEESTVEGDTTEDPLTETEKLVEMASQELDKLEQETIQEGEDLGETTEPPTDEEALSPAVTEEVVDTGDVPPAEAPPDEAPPAEAPPAEAPPAEAPPVAAPPVEAPPAEAPPTETAQGTQAPAPTAGESAILKEVAECEAQCAEISAILVELRTKITQLLSKPSRSQEEDAELEASQNLLNVKMKLLEEKTRRVETLMMQAKGQSYDQPQTEDALPKVIICGVTENNMPKIIVCDGKKKKRLTPRLNIPSTCPPCVMPEMMNVMAIQKPNMIPCPPCPPCPRQDTKKFVERLSESYNMQEKLAADNADLEGMRHQLQEDLIDKDQTVDTLQRKLASLQAEMRMIVKENNLLNDKLEKAQKCQQIQPPCGKGDSPRSTKKMPCGKGRGICKADVEGRLNEYSETTQQLEKQLTDMEEEVRTMQNELIAVRQERMHLEQHRRMMATCPGTPCPAQPVCPAMPCGMMPCPNNPPMLSCSAPCPRPSPCPVCCPAPCNRPCGPSLEQQLRELREKYNYLQEDYKGKLTEVAGLRAEVDKLKQNALEAEQAKKAAEEKSKECARLLKEAKDQRRLQEGSSEQITELQQQLSVAKQRYREVKDELEEVRALVEEHKAQMEEYRAKYMAAQQTVEEQRRQIDMMELENARIAEQVNLEIQRVKNQFQEKLQELTPLPDILKATQKKLQETQQMHLLAERKNELLLKDLQTCRDKAGELEMELEKMKSDELNGAGEVGVLQSRFAELEEKYKELQDENDELKQTMATLQETLEDTEKQLREKMHEIAQLSAEVDNVREESARQIARTKDRCETIRRSMQLQITELERQLACCRALTRAAQKDRDEIRQKMQAQINNLNENFEDAQMRIRNLQGHVNFLKHSYTNVVPPPADVCNCASANEAALDAAPRGDAGGLSKF